MYIVMRYSGIPIHMVEFLFVAAGADWHLWSLKLDEDYVDQNRKYIKLFHGVVVWHKPVGNYGSILNRI